ncbi:unnamed protein product [Lampetra planeri]
MSGGGAEPARYRRVPKLCAPRHGEALSAERVPVCLPRAPRGCTHLAEGTGRGQGDARGGDFGAQGERRERTQGELLSAVASTPSVPASLPLDVITQLGTHPRFRRWLREDEARAALLAPLERCLARGKSTRPDAERLASCVAALATLAGYGGAVRAALAARRELWDACLDLAERCVQERCAEALLGDLVGLLLRLAEEDNDTVQGIAGRVTRTCLPLLGDPSGRTVMMSLALLGRVLPRSEVAVNDAVSAGVVSSLLGSLEARDGGRVAVLAARPLAAVTQKSAAARGQLAQSRAGLDALLALIEGSTGAGEGLEGAQGNAALCLGHCAASPLLPGRAVPALMRHAARSGAPPAPRANCASRSPRCAERSPGSRGGCGDASTAWSCSETARSSWTEAASSCTPTPARLTTRAWQLPRRCAAPRSLCPPPPPCAAGIERRPRRSLRIPPQCAPLPRLSGSHPRLSWLHPGSPGSNPGSPGSTEGLGLRPRLSGLLYGARAGSLPSGLTPPPRARIAVLKPPPPPLHRLR